MNRIEIRRILRGHPTAGWLVPFVVLIVLVLTAEITQADELGSSSQPRLIASTRPEQQTQLDQPASLRERAAGVNTQVPGNGRANAKSAPPEKPARKPMKLPGIVIEFDKRYVDLKATICLTDGLLELVACTEGSKEHESIVAVAARPMHIHTALLLLGANNGHPAMRKLVDKQKSHWVNRPARGDAIQAFLLMRDKTGKLVEQPIRDVIVSSQDRLDEAEGRTLAAPKPDTPQQASQFPAVFVFAGSHLRDQETGRRQYLADRSGHVISIATFGDELLCLPNHQTQSNGSLHWRIKPDSLPPVGTSVTLRLRPHLGPATPPNQQSTRSANLSTNGL
ncbi:MAG: YdjY domain-containing protein [Rubripirellula sp.]|nr:YdjY domain-containing protein [Rubripirellula sp.]